MPAKTHGERLDRLEQIVQILAEDHLSLKDDLASLKQIVADLATETRRGFDQAAEESRELRERFRETDERFRRTDERLLEMSREGRERERRLDDRIDKLVSAIGEILRTQNPPQQR